MEIDIYNDAEAKRASKLLSDLREMCARNFGVTLQGNRLTLRWSTYKDLKQVHMVILSVDDGKPEPPEVGD